MDAPYEWWMEGGEGELGAFIGVVRTQNLDPDTTVYTFSHNYNSDGKIFGGGYTQGRIQISVERGRYGCREDTELGTNTPFVLKEI